MNIQAVVDEAIKQAEVKAYTRGRQDGIHATKRWVAEVIRAGKSLEYVLEGLENPTAFGERRGEER